MSRHYEITGAPAHLGEAASREGARLLTLEQIQALVPGVSRALLQKRLHKNLWRDVARLGQSPAKASRCATARSKAILGTVMANPPREQLGKLYEHSRVPTHRGGRIR